MACVAAPPAVSRPPSSSTTAAETSEDVVAAQIESIQDALESDGASPESWPYPSSPALDALGARLLSMALGDIAAVRAGHPGPMLVEGPLATPRSEIANLREPVFVRSLWAEDLGRGALVYDDEAGNRMRVFFVEPLGDEWRYLGTQHGLEGGFTADWE